MEKEVKDRGYKYDDNWKFINEQKMECVKNQKFEAACNWRDKEVAYVLDKYGINITKHL